MSLHFCDPCYEAYVDTDEDEAVPPHTCINECRGIEFSGARCAKPCECGGPH